MASPLSSDPPRDGVDRSVDDHYADLRKLARQLVRKRHGLRQLEPTELVHELYLRLARAGSAGVARHEFMAMAASVLRHILVDHARELATLKRGGPYRHVTLGTNALLEREEVDVLALHEALERLAALDPRMARVVELRFFGGLTGEETARVIGASPRTVDHEWFVARAWLHRALRP